MTGTTSRQRWQKLRSELNDPCLASSGHSAVPLWLALVAFALSGAGATATPELGRRVRSPPVHLQAVATNVHRIVRPASRKGIGSAKLVVQVVHPNGATCLTYSPDGRILATGDRGGAIYFWNADKLEQVGLLRGQRTPVKCLAYEPSGQRLVSSGASTLFGGNNGRLWIWNISNGTFRAINTDSSFGSPLVRFRADAKLQIFSDHGPSKLWDLSTRRPIATIDTAKTLLSADGTLAAHAVHGASRPRPDATGGLEDSFHRGPQADPDEGKSFEYPRDASATAWELRSASNYRRRFRVPYSANAQFTPDLRYFVICRDGAAELYPIRGDKHIARVLSQKGYMGRPVFSSDGKYMAALVTTVVRHAPTPDEQDPGETPTAEQSHRVEISWRIVLWDLSTFTVKKQYSMLTRGDEAAMAFRPYTHQLAVVCQDRTIRVLFPDNSKRDVTLKNRIAQSEQCSFGEVDSIVRNDRAHVAWNLKKGSVAAFHGDMPTIGVEEAPTEPLLYDVVIHNAGEGGNSWVQLRDLKTHVDVAGLGKDSNGHIDDIKAFSFADHGKLLITAGADWAVKVWDIASKSLRFNFTGSSRFMRRIFIAPDGRSIVGAGEEPGGVSLWNLITGKELKSVASLGRDPSAFNFSPDGTLFAVAGTDKVIRIWDVASERKIADCVGHVDLVRSLHFSRDNSKLVSGSSDGTIRLWSLRADAQVAPSPLVATLYSTQDGSWVVSDATGHFDTSDIEGLKLAHWVFSDDPSNPLPLEIFMRDYYEPRLLPRLLSADPADHPKPVRPLASLNRIQPGVKIASIRPEPGRPDLVTVKVRVEPHTGSYGQGSAHVTRHTEVYDLRLFRDGQLVGQYPAPDYAQFSFRHFDPASPEALKTWRSQSRVAEEKGAKQRVLTFPHIRLPHRSVGAKIEFSAYAFNEDRVKSETARYPYTLPPDAVAKKGRADQQQPKRPLVLPHERISLS